MEAKQIDEIVEKIIAGEIKPYKVDELVQDASLAVEIRRKYVERISHTQLEHVSKHSIDFSDASKRNIENAIGAVQVPVGLVELKVNGEYAKGKYPFFLATTEGKLVAGVNRGASAINKSGGSTAKILSNGMTRSVAIDTGSLKNTAEAMRYVNSAEGIAMLRQAFAKSNSRLNLLNVDAFSTGRLLYLRYSADTKAAMGMNMVTIAATATTKQLIEELSKRGVNAKLVSESGNMCADKKPSAINIIKGRGISVVAEAVITKEALQEYFKADAKTIEELNYVKNYMGSSLAGSLAHNAHVANILAAAFIAYGQDVAQIVDGVNAFDDAKALEDGSLYCSVYLPALEIGTYGGGTHRETAKELLKASGVYGEGDDEGRTKRTFAELIASAVLAGELNLLAAEAGQELASAHAQLKK
ncbi:MAG: hydroxymethylglutaryl-CoA reductase [Candidatus Micrarchaeia archaeon]